MATPTVNSTAQSNSPRGTLPAAFPTNQPVWGSIITFWLLVLFQRSTPRISVIASAKFQRQKKTRKPKTNKSAVCWKTKAESSFEWFELRIQLLNARFSHMVKLTTTWWDATVTNIYIFSRKCRNSVWGLVWGLHIPPLFKLTQNSKHRAYGPQKTGLQGNHGDQ